jgi:hypothetical protein
LASTAVSFTTTFGKVLRWRERIRLILSATPARVTDAAMAILFRFDPAATAVAAVARRIDGTRVRLAGDGDPRRSNTRWYGSRHQLLASRRNSG